MKFIPSVVMMTSGSYYIFIGYFTIGLILFLTGLTWLRLAEIEFYLEKHLTNRKTGV